jgi:hypothetical protein
LISIRRDLKDNLYSQWGEEGAVRQLLEIIAPTKVFTGEEDRPVTLIEFGGSRGSDHSNFFRFAGSHITLVMIEGDRSRFSGLEEMARKNASLVAINAWVDDRENNVGEILSRHGVPTTDIQGVSIDVDGDDALVFENLGVEPNFVIIEHNPTLPSDGRFRNPKGRTIGNNLGELHAVAADREMFPVCLTETNIIFLKNSFRSDVREIDMHLEMKQLDLVRFGIGFDGTLVRFSTSLGDSTAEFYHNGWANSLVIQPVPRVLRRGKITRQVQTLQMLYSVLLAIFQRPISFLIFLAKFLMNGKRPQ